ncbi:hypothetical protein [uncultured Clostridium sp.]|nr:hypothetical protein [uncultured Clostridium sp.]
MDKALKEIKRVLVPGGKFYVTANSNNITPQIKNRKKFMK